MDHGTWSVLTHLFPKADIPVIQLSIDKTKPAEFHFNLAKQLASLRKKGVLIVGSGNIVHNLRLVDFANLDKDNYGFDWAFEAREKINNWIINNDLKSLIEYEKQSLAVNKAIPTPDYYLPLLYILGLKENSENISFFNDKLVAGSLIMTSLIIS